MRLLGLLLVVGGCSSGVRGPRPKLDLTSTAERSNWVRTGRYAEAVQLCHDFARAYDHVACDVIGKTSEDREILALSVVRDPSRPTIYIQAGIHPGEIEGKDAGFLFLRDLLDGKVVPGALDRVNVAFVPVMNPDGHERFSPNNRPNQRGPEAMGFRTNALRLNLNRDHVKADSPEVRATLGVIKALDPVLFVDLHTTDGAKFEQDISVTVMPYAPRPDRLEDTAIALTDAMMKKLTAAGHLPVPFYPTFVEDDNPQSGFQLAEAPPRFGTWYVATRDRIGMLVETHSWRTFAERGKSTYHALRAIFEEASAHAAEWRTVEAEATRTSRSLAGTDVPFTWKNTDAKRELEFRGYEYRIEKSELTGGTWIIYDETKPQIWRVPYQTEVEPVITAHVPRGGYIVEGGFASTIRSVLDTHGIRYVPVAEGQALAVEAFRAKSVKPLPIYEGRARVGIEGAWAAETRTPDRGAIFIPIDQPNVRLVVHLCDPALPDSFAQWGFFNAAFEQKEYMEGYMIEAVARQMLAKDPSLAAKLEAARAADNELAKDPDKLREWFYRQHPAWDERTNLVPVYRVDSPPR